MSNQTIPNLPSAIALTGADFIQIVQNGVSLRATIQQFISLMIPTGGATVSPVVSFQQITTTSAVALQSHAYSNGVVLKAASDNAGFVYVGGVGVTTSTGYPLAAGEPISYGVANSNQVYIVGADALQVVKVTGN